MVDGRAARAPVVAAGETSVSSAHWDAEMRLIAPGLQESLQWARLSIASAHGAVLVDLDGREYVDMFGASGVNSIGHSHPAFVSAMQEQLSSWTIGAFGSRWRTRMLELLTALLPPELGRVQLYSSGSEAVEAALRLAKSATGKHEFLSFWNGFHGKTAGSLALTAGARRGLGPAPSGAMSTPFAYCYRCPLSTTYPGCGLACVDHAREVLKQQSSGALAAIVVEPVQGRAGNIPPPPGFISAIAEVARENDALLIADESLTGFGRTGRLLATEHDGVVADISVLGKGMGGGYPVTAIASSTALMSTSPFGEPSASSSSFGGFPLACTAVATTVEVIRDDDLVANSARLGELMVRRLEEQISSPIMGEVRGRGLMIGIELVEDTVSRRPASKAAVRSTFLALLERGVLVFVGGNSIRLYPPLNCPDEVALASCDIIADVLNAAPLPTSP